MKTFLLVCLLVLAAMSACDVLPDAAIINGVLTSLSGGKTERVKPAAQDSKIICGDTGCNPYPSTDKNGNTCQIGAVGCEWMGDKK